ncbi:MAG: 50S ribosomal protein L28 [Candidatus Melainabacteria bacterium RIFCSPLOWO2_02_FULL_35_15]|nr:MAG: 50S ribosomal protein L28 [Candidatus Melainabacteria bacterium RIFCSPLOWO2_12_FULL_35_11]OGI14289.1 MAG: 50S ribosomal protein L28 [Candidatus Melainabacteria bacterium RIFCSPLOWO2_02_FULL_35_15]
MSRRCDISGKKAQRGMKYSFLRAHFNPTAKRKFEVNLQTVKTTVNGKRVKLKIAASVLKAHPEIRSGIILPLKKRSRKKIKKLLSAAKP